MNLILCGLPMSGKTTIGKKLAEKLGWKFIDTDQRIEEAYGEKTGKNCTCRQIFQLEGEKKFRQLEKQQIALLKHTTKSIIAIGGGCLEDPENVKELQRIGRMIYLKSNPQELWKRVHSRGIPAYLDPQNPEASYYVLAVKRIPLYETAAHETVNIDNLTVEEIVNIIQKNIK